MRNLKRVLSLALASIMLLGMMVVGAGAASKDFTDAAEIDNVEAVDVMVALGVLEGGNKGDFQPNSILTREQAAKIICYMLLGEEAAEKLTTNYSIFSDVPANRWSAPYISYCVNLGILAGDGHGNFYPEGKLTGVAFAKMLMVCLGYSAERENYVGNNWEINTSAAAIAAGVAPKGLVLSNELSRQDAAQMAFNTLTATMVEYLNDNTIIIGDTTVSTVGKASAVKQAPYTDTMDAEYLQFAEKYFGKLKKIDDVDDFDRPAHTWSFKSEEVGTFVNWDEMVGEFTSDVTGKDLFDLLTASTIKTYGFNYYVDGKLVDDVIKASNMIRTNAYSYETTGNGALTQVFVDNNDEEIVITTINTYLAKAAADYNEKRGELSLNIYADKTVEQVVEVEDFPAIEGVEEGEAFLVNVAETTKDKYAISIMAAPEVLSGAKLTKYSKVNYLVTDGTQYDYALKGGIHNASELANYNQSALDNTYDVYLDQYGYVIGTEKVSGEAKYLFLTGYDRPTTHLGVKTAEAAAIFLDGTMEKIEVNVTKTNVKLGDKNENGTIDSTETAVTGYGLLSGSAVDAQMSRYNKWFTYSVNKDGVYTLTPVANWMNISKTETRNEINSSSLVLRKGTDKAWGNDDSVYVTVGTSGNDYNNTIISKVNATYTGVQNVDIKLKGVDGIDNVIFACYDEDNYIIGAVVLGEDINNTKNFAYGIDKDAMNEYAKDDDGYYYWDFEAVVDGEIKTLTVKTEYTDAIKDIASSIVTGAGALLELTYDKNGYVVDARVCADADDDIYGNAEYTNSGKYTEDFKAYLVDVNVTALKTNQAGNTLWIDVASGTDNGLAIAKGAPIVVVQDVVNSKGDKITTEVDVYTNFNSAFKALALTSDGKFKGQIGAVLDEKGAAKYVVLNNAIKDGVTTDDGTTPDKNYVTINVGTKTGDGIVTVEIDGKEYTITERSSDTSIKVPAKGSVALKVTGVGGGFDTKATKVSFSDPTKGTALKGATEVDWRLVNMKDGAVLVIDPETTTP